MDPQVVLVLKVVGLFLMAAVAAWLIARVKDTWIRLVVLALTLLIVAKAASSLGDQIAKPFEGLKPLDGETTSTSNSE